MDWPSLIIRFSLAFWVGGTLLVVIAAPVVFGQLSSRDAAGGVFGEILRRFEIRQAGAVAAAGDRRLRDARARRAASRVRPSSRAVAIFVAIATNVYLAMVLRPRMGYFREKVGSFDAAAADDPWRARFDRLHRRVDPGSVLGWIAAGIALALWP